MKGYNIFKLKDPTTGKIRLIGITNKSKNKIIEQIMSEGSINSHADRIIKQWVKEGKKPIVVLSDLSTGSLATRETMRNIAMLLNVPLLEETIIWQ